MIITFLGICVMNPRILDRHLGVENGFIPFDRNIVHEGPIPLLKFGCLLGRLTMYLYFFILVSEA